LSVRQLARYWRCAPDRVRQYIHRGILRSFTIGRSVRVTADDLRRAVANRPAKLLVAEVGGRLVGSVIGTFDSWRGDIDRLAVHSDFRRRGSARALAAEVEKRLAR
jgi:excisionase family DNA binding protein